METALSEEPRIGGTLVWYASICLRQVWLMAHCIDPDERNELLILGRLTDKTSYPRERLKWTRLSRQKIIGLLAHLKNNCDYLMLTPLHPLPV